jgi:Spy/CpxP family protein refolding chaperone
MEELAMRLHRQSVVLCGLIVAAIGLAQVARAQEARQIRPEVDLLKQSVSEKLQAAADKLGLSQEQRDKIKETRRSFEAKRQELREQHRALYQSDIKAIEAILTPEQRTQVQSLTDEPVEAQEAGEGQLAWTQAATARDTLVHKLRAAAEKIGLSSDQRYQIREQLAGSVEKYRDQRHARRELVKEELKAISEILTPEQREKARHYFERRIVTAPIVQSVTQRLHAAADRLGLTEDQRKRIVDTYNSYDEKYEKLADDRRELLKSELKAVGDILTPEQREKVRNYFQDHLVVIDIELDPNDPQARQMLKETIAGRLEAAAERLGLTQEQRDKIKAAYSGFEANYNTQREQREALRKEELKAMGDILTPEQREKVKNYFADVTESP